MRVGAAEPTAAASPGSSTSAAFIAAISRTTSPRAPVTTSRVRSGSRPPRAMPSPEPATIAATLMSVPSPGIESS